MKTSDILVPVDFSPCSLHALDYALSIADTDAEISLLNVIDTDLIQKAVTSGLTTKERALQKMKAQAERDLLALVKKKTRRGLRLSKMVVVGIPFVEILRIANDLDFSMIVMGVRGAGTPLKEILFGSTAERVLRATRIPVLCVPR